MADTMTKEAALELLATKWMNVPVEWLDSLIRFESGWNPKAKNPISGARGLIQFMPSTAKAMGYANADDLVNKHPTVVSQLLGPVAAYFKLPGNKGPWPTKQSLYMTVFRPANRNSSPGTVFPADVRRDNPGIKTVQDYINLVEGKRPSSGGTALAGINPILGILLLAGFLFSKFKGGN